MRSGCTVDTCGKLKSTRTSPHLPTIQAASTSCTTANHRQSWGLVALIPVLSKVVYAESRTKIVEDPALNWVAVTELELPQ